MFESEAELAYPVTLGLDARKERRHLEHQVECINLRSPKQSFT